MNNSSIRLEVEEDGGIAFIGSSGSLFRIQDNLSGSLFVIAPESGIPIFSVYSWDTTEVSGQLTVDGTLYITGSTLSDGLINYSQDFSSVYVDRSVIDKGYLDSLSGSFLPNLGTDNQIPFMDSAAEDFEYTSSFSWDGTNLNIFPLAIGTGSISSATNAIAIGNGAEAENTDCIAIGTDAGDTSSSTKQNNSTSIGPQSNSGTKGIGQYSLALGYNNSSEGNNSVAVGPYTNANGYNSISLGSQSTSKNTYVISIGEQAGSGPSYHGVSCISIGRNANAATWHPGEYSIAMGSSAISYGTGSIAMGYYTGYTSGTKGNRFVGIGYRTNALHPNIGEDSVSIGSFVTGSGDYGVAIGKQSFVSSSHGISIGYKAKSEAQDVISNCKRR